MFRLPQGVTWPMVVVVVVVVFGGMWVSKYWLQRQTLLVSLAAHAQAHPEDAPVTKIVIGCAKRVIPDDEECSQELLAAFGPEVLGLLNKLEEAGAFGQAIGPESLLQQ